MSKISRIILLGGGALVLTIVVVNLWWRHQEATPYAAELLDERVNRDEFFRTRPESPLPTQVRFAHRELPYYPPDEEYIVTATFRRVDEAPMEMQQPGEKPMPRAGVLSFTLKGRKAELSAYFLQPDRYDKLFVPFRDVTSNKTTYGGGRYLYPVLKPDNTVELDFNRAVNPNCAYNHDYVCPLPPPENALSFAVEAGEKKYSDPH